MSVKGYFNCSDGHRLAYNVWLPEKNVKAKAFVQILHGMAEHSDRYEEFAHYLNSRGFGVFASDHRGHGETASPEELGWFAEKDGWNRVCKDCFEFADYIASLYSVSTTFMFGHSMGSFLARTIMVEHPDLYSGVIICGTGADKGLLGKIGKIICRSQIKKSGAKAKAVRMNKLSFGSFNRAFEPANTDFDWLSSDSSEVEKYINDPKCGFICTNGFFMDLLSGMEYANSPVTVSRVPKDLPLLLISGEMDPVGDMGKGVKKVYRLYKNAGVADVTLKLLPGDRHEILNEINRVEVYDIIAEWILSHIS